GSREERPVHRQRKDVGSTEGQIPWNLGELVVVADGHAESAEVRIDQGAGTIARSEHQALRTPEMSLAVVGQACRGSQDRSGVEQVAASSLAVSDDDDGPVGDRGMHGIPTLIVP